jgi:hypothetical protein
MNEKKLTPSQYFHITGGDALPSISALCTSLKTMTQQQFDAHVTAEKNDFAQWVGGVFGEKELAKTLRRCATKEDMAWILDDFLADNGSEQVLSGPRAPATSEISDAEFDAHKDEISATNERITQRYEEIARRMQRAFVDPLPKEIEQAAETLKLRQSELLLRISEARRAGKDMLMPSLVIRQFIPKLSIALATKDKNDLEIARIVLESAEHELTEALASREVDVKADILALAALETQKDNAGTRETVSKASFGKDL